MSDIIGISNAAVAAGANRRYPDKEKRALRCTKVSLRGQPNVHDLTRVVHHDRAVISKISLAESASRLAPLVAARGDADTSVSKVMAEASGVAASAVGTASYKDADGVRILVAWAMEALRPSLVEKGVKVYLPSPVAPQQGPAEEPAGPVEQPALASQTIAASPSQQGGVDATPAQQQKSGAQQQRSVERVAGAGKGATQSDAAEPEAAKTGARTAAQRSQAAEALEPKKNDKLVTLVRSSGPEILRELRLRLDPALEVMRDVDGMCTWYDLVVPLESAMRTAMDLNLWDARKTLSDTIARGGRMVAACSNPPLVLGVFSKMLPFVQGVSQEVHEADCADLRRVHALTRIISRARPGPVSRDKL